METLIQSFEVTKGGKSGDLLSQLREDKKLKIGFLGCGYFEYWRMYSHLRDEVINDMQIVADRLSEKHDIVYPGLVETLDAADAAGRFFKKKEIDTLIIAEGTYVPDFFIHQTLSHLPADINIICFATSLHGKIDFNAGYDVSLRNSGMMALVQLTGGFKKMGKYNKWEVVFGALEEDEAYDRLDEVIQVFTTIKNLRSMTIGVVGHVFRGMYDFEYDKTAVTGKFGPHVMDVNVDHLMDIHEEIGEDDPRIKAILKRAKSKYTIVDLADEEILRSARLAVAFQELVKRYKLNGLVVLGQHLIEAKANSTCYLGISELILNDEVVVVTEGDVLGVIITKILKDFTGHTPFFGEWEEMDTTLNAIMLLGHGFIDARECRTDRPVYLKPSSENWGYKGHSVGFEATYAPGPVTMAHVIQDTEGWRILISEGEIMDTPPMHINECAVVVKVDKPIKQYFEELMRFGFSHHSIAVPGKVGKQLESLARQLEIEVCRL